MTFDQLEYFLSVVECNSFSRAAEEIHLSQPSLSKQIKSMEAELGENLLVRRGSLFEITDCGKLFMEFAKRASAEYRDLLCHLPRNQDYRHRLRLGALPLLYEYNIMGLISKFRMQHEHIHLTLHEDGQTMLMKMLNNRQLDVIIAYSDFILPYKYEYFTLNYDDLCIMCSKYNPLSIAKSVSIEQIENEQLIILEQDASIIYNMLYNACLSRGFIPRITLTSNSHKHLLGMLRENTSMIAALPGKLAVQEYSRDITVLPLKESIYTTTSIIKLKEAEKNACVDDFFEYFNEEMKFVEIGDPIYT